MSPQDIFRRGDSPSVPAALSPAPETGDGPPTSAQRLGKAVVALLDGAVDRVVLVFLLLLLSLGLYCLYDSSQVYSSADAAQYSAFKPVEDDSPSFAQLRSINPEVVGWLSVNDTPIDYPVVRGKNNQQYLNTTVEGEYRLSGSIFLDYRNAPGLTDFNNIVFGHHMEQEKMFGCLSNFGDAGYFDAHPFGGMYLRDDWSGDTSGTGGFRSYGLEFFAVILTDAYDSLYSPAVPEEEQQAYLDHLYDIALHTREMKVSTRDRLVLLSTCTTERTNGRYILVGKLTDTLHPQTFPPKVDIIGAGVDTLTRFPGILFWFVAILALRVSAVLHRRTKR